jgi:cytochrome P450
MLVAPDVQRKAQEEVDRVTPGRLPTFEDERSMPYVTAVVYECLRWNNVTPLGIPHYSTAEDVYNGYRIPIGSIVVGNTW